MSQTLPAVQLTEHQCARLRRELTSLEPTLVQLRRDLHAHPELSWSEHRTSAVIAGQLSRAGLRVRPLSGSGLVADLGAEQPRTRVALRADLDALPVIERTGLEFSSTIEGVAHACGHDVHTTVVLGAGLALAAMQEELNARGLGVRLLFQPAEEQMPGGAHQVIKQSGLDEVDAVYAVHCDPSIDVGHVGLATGPITSACDAVSVTLSGRGGHTSRPHLTQDLVYALGKVITDVPGALSRRLDPRAGAVLVWGQVQSGNAPNVIPADGKVSGTLRVLDLDVWHGLGEQVKKIVHEVVAPYEVTVEIDYTPGVPPVVNDSDAVTALAEASTAGLGPDSVVTTRQSLGGEDFAWYLAHVPGALARLGTRTHGGPTYELHQGDLVIDEAAIRHGATVLALAALTTRR